MTSKKSTQKYVYLFGEVEEVLARVDGDWEALRGLLGGKGVNLFDATSLGIPVPPGFTVTTEGCNDYLAANQKFPKGLWDQALEAVTELEKITGKRFGNPENPLAGVLPFRREILDAGHDGHHSQYRHERRNCREHGETDQTPAFCLRSVSPAGADVRRCRDGCSRRGL